MLKMSMPQAWSSIAAAMLLLGLCAAPAFCASDSPAPDWLHAAAREISPQYPPETVAVVILDEQQTTVKDNGKIETVHRRAVRILRPEAREDFSRLFVEFNGHTKIPQHESVDHYIRWPRQPPRSRTRTQRDKGTNEEMYTDVHLRALKFLEVNPGSVIGYEYVQEQRPFMYEDRWDFQDRVPVRTSRFILQLPTGWEYSSQWINYKEQPPCDKSIQSARLAGAGCARNRYSAGHAPLGQHRCAHGSEISPMIRKHDSKPTCRGRIWGCGSMASRSQLRPHAAVERKSRSSHDGDSRSASPERGRSPRYAAPDSLFRD